VLLEQIETRQPLEADMRNKILGEGDYEGARRFNEQEREIVKSRVRKRLAAARRLAIDELVGDENPLGNDDVTIERENFERLRYQEDEDPFRLD
jgi:hypothetical protein